MIWFGTARELGEGKMRWDIRFQDEEAARRFLPVEIDPARDFMGSVYLARPEQDRARTDTFGQRNVRAGQNYSQEFQCRLKDGALVWLKEDVTVEAMREGLWKVIGVCTDITPQKQTEEDFQRLMRGSHCLLWHALVQDHGDRLGWDIRVVNEAAAAAFLPIAQEKGQSYTDAWLA